MTKRENQIIKAYSMSKVCDIKKAYSKPSQEKMKAWAYCREFMDRKQGHDLKVIGHNCHVFSAGFLFENPDTGVIQLMYITPEHNRAIDYVI